MAGPAKIGKENNIQNSLYVSKWPILVPSVNNDQIAISTSVCSYDSTVHSIQIILGIR